MEINITNEQLRNKNIYAAAQKIRSMCPTVAWMRHVGSLLIKVNMRKKENLSSEIMGIGCVSYLCIACTLNNDPYNWLLVFLNFLNFFKSNNILKRTKGTIA